MVSNRTEPSETADIGPDDPCGGLIGVALSFFVAGGLVALALVAASKIL